MIERGDLDVLAGLYDRFAHSLDPFSEDSHIAEQQFHSEVARLFEMQNPQPDFREFRRKTVALCRARLLSGDKPSAI
jgi:hypothetical protein